jgi:hypothetical protein
LQSPVSSILLLSALNPFSDAFVNPGTRALPNAAHNGATSKLVYDFGGHSSASQFGCDARGSGYKGSAFDTHRVSQSADQCANGDVTRVFPAVGLRPQSSGTSPIFRDTHALQFALHSVEYLLLDGARTHKRARDAANHQHRDGSRNASCASSKGSYGGRGSANQRTNAATDSACRVVSDRTDTSTNLIQEASAFSLLSTLRAPCRSGQTSI